MATTTIPAPTASDTARYLRLTQDKTNQWTMPDIAEALDVKPQTVRSWRKEALGAHRDNPLAPPHPNNLPREDGNAFGRPWWYAGTIREWAMQTGRMDRKGQPLRLKPPGRPRSNRIAA